MFLQIFGIVCAVLLVGLALIFVGFEIKWLFFADKEKDGDE